MESTLAELVVQSLEVMSVEEIKAACARSEPVPVSDPMLSRAALPFQETFYPFGFPLQVSTNAQEVLDLCREAWSGFHQLFDIAPIRFQIGVTEGGTGECPPAPTSRVREHLCSHIADSQNYCVSDASQSFSFMWLSQTSLAYKSYVRYFMLESSAMFHLASRHSIAMHAACVELDGAGILLCGDSGAGKSTLSYACARAGWTYVTDDASFLVNGRDDSLVVGNCSLLRFRPSSEAFFPELRNRPVLQRAESGKPSVEISTASLGDIKAAFSSRIRHIVFLNRDPREKPELVPLAPEIARGFIFQRGLGVHEAADLQVASVRRLLARGVFELRYTDLAWAVDRLTRLMREGR